MPIYGQAWLIQGDNYRELGSNHENIGTINGFIVRLCVIKRIVCSES